MYSFTPGLSSSFPTSAEEWGMKVVSHYYFCHPLLLTPFLASGTDTLSPGIDLHTLLQWVSSSWAAAPKNCSVGVSHGIQTSWSRLLQNSFSMGQQLLHGLHSMLHSPLQEPVPPWASHRLQLPLRCIQLLLVGGPSLAAAWLEGDMTLAGDQVLSYLLDPSIPQKERWKKPRGVKIRVVLCKGKAMVSSSSFPLPFFCWADIKWNIPLDSLGQLSCLILSQDLAHAQPAGEGECWRDCAVVWGLLWDNKLHLSQTQNSTSAPMCCSMDCRGDSLFHHGPLHGISALALLFPLLIFLTSLSQLLCSNCYLFKIHYYRGTSSITGSSALSSVGMVYGMSETAFVWFWATSNVFSLASSFRLLIAELCCKDSTIRKHNFHFLKNLTFFQELCSTILRME